MSSAFHRVGGFFVVAVGLAGCVETGSGIVELAAPGEVIARARLGNNTEDITFVDRGRMANHVVVVDGGQAIAIPTTGPREPRLLFNTAALGLEQPPRGVAFVSAERRLVFNDLAERDRLVFADLDGQLVDELTIIYPGGFLPDHVEGLEEVPASLGGTLAMVVWRFGAQLEARIEIIDRATGHVAREIVIDPAIASVGITAIAYDDGGFLISPINDEIHRVDLDGAITGAPVTVGELTSIEGLAAARGGFYAAGYGAGRLIALDRRLDRRHREDRDYLVGFGLSRVVGVAWRDDLGALRVGAQLRAAQIAAVSDDLSELEVVASIPAGGQLTDVSTIPSEELDVASFAFDPNGLLLVDVAGDVVAAIDLGPQIPVRVAHIAPTGELAVVFAGDPTTLHVFDRAGAPVRSVDLAGAGLLTIAGLDVDDTGPSPRLVAVDQTGRVVETDLDGALINSADYAGVLGRDFPLLSLGGLAVLRGAGALAFANSDTNELVVVGRL